MDFKAEIINFFQFPPTLSEIILLSVVALTFIYQLYYYIRYIAGANRYLRRKKKNKIALSEIKPPVSVIICARNELENLRTFLPTLLCQTYPIYEIIVVDDRSQDDTRNYLQQLSVLNNRLRYTFVPEGPYSMSTKKLALTLGFKAAHYNHLLLIDADCRPEGDNWIATMMQGFTKGKDIVLGFGAYEKESTHLNRLIAYDTQWNGMQFLGQALSGHPYMGVGRNLAYTKDLFFERGGFQKHINILSGDDDLFINQVATAENTNVVIDPEATTWSIPKTSFSEWFWQKRRHLSVSTFYRTSTKIRLLGEPLSRGLFYLSVLLCCVMCRTWVWTIALALLLIRFIWQICIMDVFAKRMNLKMFHINILWFDVVLPLVQLWMMTMNKIFPDKRKKW